MTFNEIFSAIGKSLGEIFHYLGNTPIEDLFSNLIIIIFTGLFLWVFLWLIILIRGLVETLFYKIFSNKNTEKVPLEKQPMYIMGKKMKNFFSKKNKRNKKR